MSHRYPTRFQQNKLQMALVNQAIDRKNHLMDEVSKVNTYTDRLDKLIHLYEYIRDTPILMESVDGFREDVWDKLNILEKLLIEKSQRLDPFNMTHGYIEVYIHIAMTLIEDIRNKYY